MAERRMFTKKVTDDDNFTALSSSAQALYLHLSMSADDDGFCNQITVAMFRAHASVQDLQALLEKRYVYQFDNGVIVIKHWRMANALRKDRYTPTAFQEELAKLELKDNGAYTMVANRLPSGCQVVAERLPQVSIGKIREGKNRVGEDRKGDCKGKTKFSPPALDEVKVYAIEQGLECDPEAFYDHFTANGWRVGKGGTPMKDWRAALRNWARREAEFKPRSRTTRDSLAYDPNGPDRPEEELPI